MLDGLVEVLVKIDRILKSSGYLALLPSSQHTAAIRWEGDLRSVSPRTPHPSARGRVPVTLLEPTLCFRFILTVSSTSAPRRLRTRCQSTEDGVGWEMCSRRDPLSWCLHVRWPPSSCPCHQHSRCPVSPSLWHRSPGWWWDIETGSVRVGEPPRNRNRRSR